MTARFAPMRDLHCNSCLKSGFQSCNLLVTCLTRSSACEMSQTAVQGFQKADTPEPDTQQLQPPQEGWEDESRKEAASKAGNVMSVPIFLT
jgi:hypothetical protein